MNPILTAITGNNSDLIENVWNIYKPEIGGVITDVTYGKGVFWKKINLTDYDFRASDLMDGVDFCNLHYEDNEVDLLVLDPPYMHGGETVKSSINDCYKNQNTSHESVFRLYAGGILEAARVLKKSGMIWVKLQDEIESGKQRFTSREVMDFMESSGFLIIDVFVLVQSSIPAMRVNYQKSARKNHSYLIVGKYRR
jgi:tRNA G10  N-methylase Trm11